MHTFCMQWESCLCNKIFNRISLLQQHTTAIIYIEFREIVDGGRTLNDTAEKQSNPRDRYIDTYMDGVFFTGMWNREF